MVKVRRERPSQRLNHRVSAPIMVEVGGETCTAVDWSLGGFCLDSTDVCLEAGEDFLCIIRVPFQGFDISFAMEAEAVREDENGLMGCRFKSVGDREREIMTHFVDELVRGSMTVIDDVILRVDTPVTPVSMEPDPNPIEQIPVRRIPIKQIMMVGLYGAAGLCVTGYAIMAFIVNFMWLEVDTAVVSAPMQSVISTVDGKILRVAITPGDVIPSGQAMFIIENAKLEEKVEMAKIKINRLTLELDCARARNQGGKRSDWRL